MAERARGGSLVLKVGAKAPDFELTDQAGEMVTLSGLLAQGDLILYFYPADFTPVCTAEACAFRDNYDGVSELGVQVVGVSPQSASSHSRFAERHNIPFPLLADTRKQVIRKYGVDGLLGIGVRRVTFLIGADGLVKNRVVADFTVSRHLDLLKSASL